ncbi:MAG: transporter substrate-binding domain-containing protein, partial [Verrucomicrobiales bacterium]
MNARAGNPIFRWPPSMCITGAVSRFGIWSSILLAFSLSLSTADALELQFTAEERAWLAEHETIVVGGEMDWAPFDFVDEAGNYAGIANDYLQIVGEELGLEIEIVTDPLWDELIEKIKSKEIDVLPAIYYAPERDQFLKFTEPYARVTEFIYAREDTQWISTIDDLKGKRVSVVKGYSIEEALRVDYPEITMVTAANIQDCLKKLVLGEVDAFIGDIASTSFNIRTYSLSGIKAVAAGPFSEPTVHMGVREDWPELRDLIQKVLDALPEERHVAIKGRWFSQLVREEGTGEQEGAAGSGVDEGSLLEGRIWWLIAVGLIVLVLLIPVLLQRLGGDQEKEWFSSAAVRRIGAVAVVLFLVLVMVLTWFSLGKVDKRLRRDLGSQLTIVNKSVNQALGAWFDVRRERMLDLAQEPGLSEATETLLGSSRAPEALRGNPTLETVRALLLPDLDRMDARNMFIIAPDRISIASMRDANLGTPNLIEQQRPELMERALAGEMVFIPPVISDVPLVDEQGQVLERAPTMFFATPLRNAGDEVIAVMAVGFDPSTELSRVTREGRMGETGETYAIDKNGRLLTESRFEESLISSGLGTAPEAGDSGVSGFRVADPGGNLLEGHVPESERADWPLTLMASEAIRGGSGIDMEGYNDYRGVPVIGAWLWSDELGIGLATEFDQEEALAPYLALRNLVVGALGVTTLLALALIGFSVWLGDQAKTRLERQVRERTRELSKLVQAVEQSPLCVVITDVEGAIEHVNPAFVQLTGYEPDEVIGENPRILKSGETPVEQYA